MIHVDNLYLVSSTLWSLIGLFVGYGIGCYHQHIKEGRASMPSDPPPPVETPAEVPADPPAAPTPPAHHSWHDRASLTRTVTGVLILLLVVGTMVELARTTSCQAAYNAAVARSIAVRAEAQADQLDRSIDQLDAQLALLTPSGPGPSDPAARAAGGQRRVQVYRDAVVANRDALIKLRSSRVDNPPPDAERCGGEGFSGSG